MSNPSPAEALAYLQGREIEVGGEPKYRSLWLWKRSHGRLVADAPRNYDDVDLNDLMIEAGTCGRLPSVRQSTGATWLAEAWQTSARTGDLTIKQVAFSLDTPREAVLVALAKAEGMSDGEASAP